jgi:hypothetical protein
MNVPAMQLAALEFASIGIVTLGDTMTANIGNAERMIRLIAGALFLALGFFAPLHPYIAVALLAAGVIAVITAVVRFCPVWAAMGINTCGR